MTLFKTTKGRKFIFSLSVGDAKPTEDRPKIVWLGFNNKHSELASSQSYEQPVAVVLGRRSMCIVICCYGRIDATKYYEKNAHVCCLDLCTSKQAKFISSYKMLPSILGLVAAQAIKHVFLSGYCPFPGFPRPNR